ncbi:cytokinesis protein sepA-like [Melanaphis sacchari]|uniref:cytokinesis protein sepA-like n=1 Tax=Melanaphis sacchari TaxID=742174 RepID=UPI000DC14D2F|nr:cytokinesis protein sepA-like [Melanaphis sacchari]
MFKTIRYYISTYCGFAVSSDNDCNLQRKEDLEDEEFFDAESGSELPKLYRGEEEVQTSKELKLQRLDERCPMNLAKTLDVTDMRGLLETVQKLQTNLEKQQSIIEKKNSYKDRLKDKIKELEKQYKSEKEKKRSQELQSHHFEEYSSMNLAQTRKVKDMRELLDTVQKLKNAVEKQQFKIEKKKNCDEELKSLKLDMNTVNNNLNTMIANVNDLRIQMMFIEGNNKTSNSKIDKLKSRIRILEREVTNNSVNIIGMSYSYQSNQALPSTRLNLGATVSLGENNFQCIPTNIVMSPSSMTTMKSTSPPQVPNLPPPPPKVLNLPPPPPPTPISAVFGPPPPPPPPPVKSSLPLTCTENKETTAKPDKTTPIYYRIPITEEILKSVVLKPPGQRKFRKKFST